MKYFTSALWCRINSTDSNIRESAKMQWKTANAEYDAVFNKLAANSCPSDKEILLFCDQLHDSKITQIALSQSDRSSWQLHIHVITHNEEKAVLTLKGIEEYSIAAFSLEYCILGNISWGYCEFSKDNNELWHLSILCDMFNEINASFHSMSLVRVHNN